MPKIGKDIEKEVQGLLGNLGEKVDKLKRGGKQVAVDISRGFEDLGNPPSTLTQLNRIVEDFWRNEMEPQMKSLDGTVKKGLQDFQKSFAEFQKDPAKNMEEAAKFFAEEAKKCKEAVSNSKILKEFGKFLESTCNMVKAIVTGKEIKESWQKVKESGSSVALSIKEAVLGKEKGMSRA